MTAIALCKGLCVHRTEMQTGSQAAAAGTRNIVLCDRDHGCTASSLHAPLYPQAKAVSSIRRDLLCLGLTGAASVFSPGGEGLAHVPCITYLAYATAGPPSNLSSFGLGGTLMQVRPRKMQIAPSTNFGLSTDNLPSDLIPRSRAAQCMELQIPSIEGLDRSCPSVPWFGS